MQLSGTSRINFLSLTLLLQIKDVLSFNYTSASLYPREISASHAISQQFYGCSEAQIERIQAAHNEAYIMIRKAARKLDSIIDSIFVREPGPGDTITGEQLSALRTFEVIYGQAYFGQNDKRNDQGLERVHIIQRLAQKIVGSYESTRLNDMEVWRSDYLQTEILDGTRIPYQEDPDVVLYWDNRPAERGGQSLVKGANCDRPSIVAITRSLDTPGGLLTLLRFCPPYLDQWPRQPTEDLQPYNAGTLQELSDRHISPIYVHELSHAKILVGGRRTKDMQVNIGGRTKGAYGWTRVTTLARRKPDNAVQNADSFRLFVVAMYFDRVAWRRNIQTPHPADQVGWVGEMQR